MPKEEATIIDIPASDIPSPSIIDFPAISQQVPQITGIPADSGVDVPSVWGVPMPKRKSMYDLVLKSDGNSIYKSNPLENPKVAKDVIENSDAVYGYSLKPESKLNSFGVDWTNPDEVAYAQSERIRYHEHLEQKKTMLKDEISTLQNNGYSMEDIARMKVEQRNQDRINNYIKSNNYDGLEAMKQRNIEEYQRAEGPTPDQLYKKYGSWEEVIYSSVRSNPAMDVVTGLYDIYGGN